MARLRKGDYEPEKFFDKRGLDGSITVADRVFRAMCFWARKWAPLETSGALMWIGPGSVATIVAAGPCGPGAIHERLHSCPTLEYMNHSLNLVRHNRPNIYLAGVWHTHPFQDEPVPSPRDLWGVNEEADGYFGWDRENFDGTGHVEAIIARKKTRLWYVQGDTGLAKSNYIWLLAEFDIGIDLPLTPKT